MFNNSPVQCCIPFNACLFCRGAHFKLDIDGGTNTVIDLPMLKSWIAKSLVIIQQRIPLKDVKV